MMEKLQLTKKSKVAIAWMALFFAMSFTANAQCVADAAAIEITGSGDTETSICVDGNPDPIDVTIVGVGVGTNNGWVITDNTTGTILALPPGPPFNLDGAGPGVCDIWYLRYEPGLTGLTVGQNVSDLAGCFDLSNPIEVIREAADGGTVAIDIAATGNPNNTTSISADGLTAVICVDGRPDPLVVTHVNTAPNLSYRYVITDNSPDSNILAIAGTNEINLDGAGPGTCQIWGWSYRGLTDNGASFIGSPLADLQAVDCSDISDNSIEVIREAADGGTVAIDIAATGNPNNTTSISADGLTAVICVDGRPDPLVVTHVNTAPNLSYRYVITDNSPDSNILAIAGTNEINLDGAGPGTCQIWGWSYRGLADNGASFIGSPLADLQAVDCSDISDNSIEVIREAADGGTVAIDIAATGNPNNTTSISADGLTAVICVDGRPDPLVVTHVNTAPNLSYRYVITDNSPDSNILAIAGTNEINLDGAGPGTCQIWGWSYRGLADNGASFIGSPLADLQAVDCSDISDNSISVIREEADGGEVRVDLDATGNPNNTTTISADGESVVICVDGRPDPLVVVHENTAPNLTYRYVITDLSETILAIADTNTIDLDGAGTGACRIWGWSYRGLDQNAFIGSPLSELAAEDCSDISDNSILVVRQAADGGNVEIDITATGNPNNTTSISADGMTAVICVDGRPDPIVVTHNTSAAFLSYRYVITNEDGSEILAITDSDTISLDGAGVGTCQIWGWSYRGLADNGASFIGSPLSDLQAVDCSDLSDESITVIREAADGGTVSLANGDTEVTICAGDGVADPLEVIHVNESPNLTYMYVITDSDADNTILAISPSSTIDLEGAGAGVCRIWGWSYRGLDGASFIGQPLDALQTEDCSDISADFVEVTRQTGSDCILAVTDVISSDDFSIYPNPASSIVNIAYQGNQSLTIDIALYDITGRSVQQITLDTQSSATLNVSGLPSGVYILNMVDSNSGNSVNKRLIIR